MARSSWNLTSFRMKIGCLSYCWDNSVCWKNKKKNFCLVPQASASAVSELTAKYGLHAESTTLCAFRNFPSAANVQSTRVPFSSNVSNTDISVLWWLFHRRQNCWSSSMAVAGWMPLDTVVVLWNAFCSPPNGTKKCWMRKNNSPLRV